MIVCKLPLVFQRNETAVVMLVSGRLERFVALTMIWSSVRRAGRSLARSSRLTVQLLNDNVPMEAASELVIFESEATLLVTDSSKSRIASLVLVVWAGLGATTLAFTSPLLAACDRASGHGRRVAFHGERCSGDFDLIDTYGQLFGWTGGRFCFGRGIRGKFCENVGEIKRAIAVHLDMNERLGGAEFFEYPGVAEERGGLKISVGFIPGQKWIAVLFLDGQAPDGCGKSDRIQLHLLNRDIAPKLV